MCFLFSPHPKTIFRPAEENKYRINKRRHWQRQNNYTLLYPIYINKPSPGKREKGVLTVLFKLIFQGTAHHVWNVFMAARVFYIADEIFGLVWPGRGRWVTAQSWCRVCIPRWHKAFISDLQRGNARNCTSSAQDAGLPWLPWACHNLLRPVLILQ